MREDDLWTVTLIGYLGEQPPTDLEGFCRYAAAVPAPELSTLLASAEPVGDAAVTRFPASRRRRFEDLAAFPEGYLVFGDVISIFNPVYGQGMTVAAEESLALAAALLSGLNGLPQRFFAAAGRIVDTVWALSACGDLRWPQVSGQRTAQIRFLNAYVRRLTRAAHHDPVVAQAFFRTTNLLDPAPSLLRPTIAARVLIGGSPMLARLPRQRNSRQRAAACSPASRHSLPPIP